MGEFDADINVFDAFAKIASDNDVTDTEWAKGARMAQPRIAELRQILRLVREEGLTQAEASKRIRRDCTQIKINKLYRGLRQVLGVDRMKHEVRKAYKKEKNPRVRAHLLLAGLDEKFLPELEKFMLELDAGADKKEAPRSRKKRK